MMKKKTFFYQGVNAWLIEFLVIVVKFKVNIFCYKGLNLKNTLKTNIHMVYEIQQTVFQDYPIKYYGGLVEV